MQSRALPTAWGFSPGTLRPPHLSALTKSSFFQPQPSFLEEIQTYSFIRGLWQNYIGTRKVVYKNLVLPSVLSSHGPYCVGFLYVLLMGLIELIVQTSWASQCNLIKVQHWWGGNARMPWIGRWVHAGGGMGRGSGAVRHGSGQKADGHTEAALRHHSSVPSAPSLQHPGLRGCASTRRVWRLQGRGPLVTPHRAGPWHRWEGHPEGHPEPMQGVQPCSASSPPLAPGV